MKKAKFELFEGTETVEVFYMRLVKFQTTPQLQLEICNQYGDWIQTLAVFREGELYLPRLSKEYRQFFKTTEEGYIKVNYKDFEDCNGVVEERR